MLSYNTFENPQELLDCCQEPNPPGDGGDCCYDTWNTDLTKVTADWKKASAIATCKENEYNNAWSWYTMLKGWCSDWEQADDLADKICRALEIFIKHLDKVCLVTEKTNKAIEILFCMIRDLYLRVDCLKQDYDDLYKCINCLKSPELSGNGLKTCLDNYGAKLDAVIATRDDLIGKVVIALNLAFDLHDNICDDYGLKSELIYWRNIFHCEGCEEEEQGGNKGKKAGGYHNHDEGGEDNCELKPMITFPIDQDSYFIKLKDHRDDTKTRVYELKKELDKAKSKAAALQACKDSLTSAVQSLDPSGKCK
ncbi:MAG: hypothetical protein C5B52_06685 [Bacteroidetes bacterium]|nr:MAG: hypothetical protein C5B52_06685 [Bacteroidota bacterium]